MFRERLRRIISRALVLLALIGAGVVAAAAPAQALDYPTGCTSSWSSWRTTGSPTWGQWRYCTADNGPDNLLIRFQVDDTLTDGYAVHIEANQIGSWSEIPWHLSPGCLQSTGNGETSAWPGWGLFTGEQVSIRLVKGTCAPHGNYGTSGAWIIANP